MNHRSDSVVGRAVVAAAALVVAACAEPSSPSSSSHASAELGRRADAIQGGTSDTTSTFAVEVFDEAGDFCSGTLIGPNLVLTARHCVADDNGGDTVDCDHDQFVAPRAASTFRVSTDAVAAFETAQYTATKVIVPKDAAFCGNDIALLVLDKLVPSSFATFAVPAIDPPLTNRAKYGSQLTAIGYGFTSPNSNNDDSVRRTRTAIPFLCIPGDTTFGCDPADMLMVATELAAGDGLCGGDSGSGAYEPTSVTAGKPIVIGVLSRASERQGNCTDATYTRTDGTAVAALLVSAAKDAAALGGYPAPTWADPNSSPTSADAGTSSGGPGADEAGAGGSNGEVPASPTDGTTTTGCSVTRPRAQQHDARYAGATLTLMTLALVAARRRRRS